MLTAFAAVGMGLLMSAARAQPGPGHELHPARAVPQLFFGGLDRPRRDHERPAGGDLGARGGAVVLRRLGSAVDINGRIAASPAYAKVSRFGDDYFAIAPRSVAVILVAFVVVSFVGVRLLLTRRQD